MDELMSSYNWMEMEVKMGGSICTDTLRITPEILKLIADSCMGNRVDRGIEKAAITARAHQSYS